MSEPDRPKSETLAANERVKAISGAFMTLGTGLFAASVARVLLIWLGLKILTLLDAEA